jgi:glycerophosphoryl diester phosphodiesterase
MRVTRPICYAHRGASAELPENTLVAFRRALDLGADALETDAHLTRDGHLVLSHDDTGERAAGVRRAIRDCTLAEVKAWDLGRGARMPTLAEALLEVPDVTFNVDAKPEGDAVVDTMVALVRRLGAQHRVRIASFHAANLRRARALGYEGETGLGQGEVTRLVFLPLARLKRAPVRGNAAQVPLHVGPIRLDTRAFIEKCHALGLRVDYWTVNDEATALRLLELGADGIMTDDPARIAPVVRAFRGDK